MTKRFTKPLLALCLFGLLASTATAQSELSVGDKAPDFEIQTLGGSTFNLSDRVGENSKPTILLFSRANW